MKSPSVFKHLRDILVLPFTVTCIVPYLIYNPEQDLVPDSPIIKSAGALILLSGISLFIYTVSLFATIGKGTLAPWSPKQKLVVVGPYKYCRNPMISGVLFILTGECLLFHSTNIAIWATCFFVINTIYFIFSEEPGLESRFGEDYRVYKQHVPRWIPRFSAYRQA
jgi:protein-S-isoprenylcysteine O-methyltransferase Ste14